MRANGNLNEVLPSLFRSVGSGSMSATVQLSSDPGMSTQTHRDSRELPAVLSASPSVTELPMMRNAMVEAALTLSAPLPLGCKLVARHCTSGFLAVVSAEVTHNIIRTCFAAPQQPGRVHFEVVDNDTGVLGMAAAMLLLPTGAATVELLLVQNSKLGLQTSAMQPSRSHPFATDLGMWIDTMLMDSSGTMNEGHRQEAERIGHAMLEFCASNHLNAIHDMLVSFKQSVYSRQHESSSAQASSAKQHVLTEDLPGLCHRRVATGAIHSELRHNTVNQGAVLPVRPTSLLHGSRIRWTLCNLVIILCAFSIKSPGMISCVGAMLHASDILLLFMAALRAIAWQQLACVLDSVERNIRPCYGLLVLLNRTIFCFAGAAGLVGVHSAVPELPPLGLVAMMPVMDLSFVFIQSPIRPLGRAIAAALVHGVAFFCMVQSYSDPSAFSAAVLVTVMVVAVHMLPERWIAPHIGPAGAHRAAPRADSFGGWHGAKSTDPWPDAKRIAQHAEWQKAQECATVAHADASGGCNLTYCGEMSFGHADRLGRGGICIRGIHPVSPPAENDAEYTACPCTCVRAHVSLILLLRLTIKDSVLVLDLSLRPVPIYVYIVCMRKALDHRLHVMSLECRSSSLGVAQDHAQLHSLCDSEQPTSSLASVKASHACALHCAAQHFHRNCANVVQGCLHLAAHVTLSKRCLASAHTSRHTFAARPAG
eukprot:364262-Chlamydomonas_euryale.AAC.11